MNQSRAYENLWEELGLQFSAVPEGHLIPDAFDRMSGGKRLSVESETALLYRIVAMQYLAVTTVMAKAEKKAPEPRTLLFITRIVDASVAWSSKAPDRQRLESICSQLNWSIENALTSMGVRRGSETSEVSGDADASQALLREVLRCARLASQIKVEHRLSKLSGFFDKLKNESKLIQWGQATEGEYERIVISTLSLWDVRSDGRERTLDNLWGRFGLGQSHWSESVYPKELGAKCIASWLMCLWPDCRLSSADLLDEIDRIGIRNTQAYESASAKGIRFTLPAPIDQFVKYLSEEIGPYA